MKNDWNYTGDVNLAEGGLYWRRGDDEFVDAIQVFPYPGTDNVFGIVEDIIWMPDDKLDLALECCGYKLVDGKLVDGTGQVHDDWFDLKVDAFFSYHGLDDTSNLWRVVRGGPKNHPYDYRIGHNASLRRYVERSWL